MHRIRESAISAGTKEYYKIYNYLGKRQEQVQDKFKELFEPTRNDSSVPDNQDFKEKFIFLYSHDYPEPMDEVFPNKIGIKILGEFDFLHSVKFYRENVFKFINQYYARQEKEGEISSEFRKFMELDGYLSPFTSFPVDDSLYLIFSPPFQRIYDDVFLLNG
jgi:hypothetical protein